MVNLVAASTEAFQVISRFPHEIGVNADLRVPLRDGRRLSARMWLPVSAEDVPVPAVIEYAPFRHRDFTYPRDAIIHPWFAGHGYASIRLEPAGALDSDGSPLDEYVAQEQSDCVEALEWIAAQPWCSGTTGMFGMSWGAFSALQVAALRPPSLKAIIPVHGTDERFGDDIHYKGGCLLTANLAWGALCQTYLMRPPSRAAFGEEWRDVWVKRMAEAPNILEAWLSHQNRDDYWKHASIREDYSSIEAATFIICGWADGYTNAALRMIGKLACPHRALIGPWAHTYPHIALPGPQIDFLGEATRWWDRWLKDEPNGADRDPKVVYYMQETVPPAPSYTYREGRWIAEDVWPSPHVSRRILHIHRNRLADQPGPADALGVRTPLHNALSGWEWLPHGVGPEMPLDQRAEDGGALCFDTAPLEGPIEICGQAIARLKLSSDTPRGTISVRLSDVAPDGAATLISYGLLNLVHRDGFDSARDMVPGEAYDIEVPLDNNAWRVPSGHRIRLAVSTQSWPLTWPARDRMMLTLHAGDSWLDLPVRALDAPDGPVPELPSAKIPTPADLTWTRPVERERSLRHDLESGAFMREYVKDDGAYIVNENGQKVASRAVLAYHATGDDPLSAKAKLSFDIEVGDADRPARLQTRVEVTADQDNFLVNGQVTATDETGIVFERPLDISVPRDAS